MGFSSELESWPEDRIRDLIREATDADVTRALTREYSHPEDLTALLSPQAGTAR